MKPLLVAAAVIFDPNRGFLCAQRPANKHLPLKWEFPGGKIEPDESPEAALHREIEEELATTLEIVEAMSLIDYHYSDRIIRLIPFLCRLTGPEPSLLWHNELRWLPKEELPTLDWAEADWPLIHQLADG